MNFRRIIEDCVSHLNRRSLRKLSNHSSGSSIIVIPYADELEWERAAEAAYYLRKMGRETVIVAYSFLTPRKFFEYIARIFGFKNVNPQLLAKLKSLQVCNYNLVGLMIPGRFFMRRLENYKIDSVFPHVVDTLKSVSIDLTSKSHRKVVARELSNYISTQIMNYCVKECTSLRHKFPDILTVNGRYSRSRAVVEDFSDPEKHVRIIETTRPRTFVIRQNAQSTEEIQRLITENWLEGLPGYKEDVGRQYLNNRLNKRSEANKAWVQSMETGNLPELPRGKNICVFYSSTQIEFIFLGDKIPENNFQNQVDAISALYAELGSDWQIVLRLHPNRNHHGDDYVEGEMWETATGFENYVIVSPNSTVDSYELANQADLVAHFGSSIGAELIFQGRVPVIGMGPSEWDTYLDSGKIRNLEELKDYIREGFPKTNPDSVLPWGYFYAQSGIAYELLSISQDQECIFEGEPIYIDLKAWVRLKLKTFIRVTSKI